MNDNLLLRLRQPSTDPDADLVKNEAAADLYGHYRQITQTIARNKHVERRNEALRKALVGLIGVDTREELEQMETFLRRAPAPDEDKVASINAIHVLLETLS